MSVESGLRTLLADNVAVKAIVDAKVYPEEAEQGVVEPYIVYRLQNTETPRDLGGAVISRRRDYEIECRAIAYDDAQALAAAVTKAVTGDSDEGVQTSLGGVNVILFWGSSPERHQNTPGEDESRNSVLLSLVVLLR